MKNYSFGRPLLSLLAITKNRYYQYYIYYIYERFVTNKLKAFIFANIKIIGNKVNIPTSTEKKCYTLIYLIIWVNYVVFP